MTTKTFKLHNITKGLKFEEFKICYTNLKTTTQYEIDLSIFNENFMSFPNL